MHESQLRFCPLYSSFSLLNYLFFFSWCRILVEVNQIQTYSQIARICLEQYIVKYQAFKLFFEDKHTEIWVKAIYCATTKCKEMNIYIEKKNQILKKSVHRNDKRC